MIEIKSVSMKYDTGSLLFGGSKKEVLKDVSFVIKKGERIGLIGINGAGKTTLIKLILGIIKPTAGKITFEGYDSKNYPDFLKRKLGVIFAQKSQLWWNIPVIDSLEVISSMYGIKKQDFLQKLSTLKEDIEISDLIKKAPRFLSFGQRIRCEIAATFIISPDYLFLDEPFIGLDSIFKQKLLSYIREYSIKNHTAIIIASHDLEYMDCLVERTLILDSSKVALDANIEELNAQTSMITKINVFLPKDSDTSSIIRLNSLAPVFPEAYWDLEEENAMNKLSLHFPTNNSTHTDFIYNFLRENFSFSSLEFKDTVAIQDILKGIKFNSPDYQKALLNKIFEYITSSEDNLSKMLQLTKLRRFSNIQYINDIIVPKLIKTFNTENDIKLKTFIITLFPCFYSKLTVEKQLEVFRVFLHAIDMEDSRLVATTVESAGNCIIEAIKSGYDTKEEIFPLNEIISIIEKKFQSLLNSPDNRVRANTYILFMKMKRDKDYLELLENLLNDVKLRDTFFYIFEVITLEYPFIEEINHSNDFNNTLINLIQSLINLWLEKKCHLSSMTVNRVFKTIQRINDTEGKNERIQICN